MTTFLVILGIVGLGIIVFAAAVALWAWQGDQGK